MNPVMLKTLITYISNHFFCTLKEKDFFNLGLFLSLLSKEMLEMEAIRDLCKFEERVEELEEEHNEEEKHEKEKDEGHGEEHKNEQEERPE